MVASGESPAVPFNRQEGPVVEKTEDFLKPLALSSERTNEPLVSFFAHLAAGRKTISSKRRSPKCDTMPGHFYRGMPKLDDPP